MYMLRTLLDVLFDPTRMPFWYTVTVFLTAGFVVALSSLG